MSGIRHRVAQDRIVHVEQAPAVGGTATLSDRARDTRETYQRNITLAIRYNQEAFPMAAAGVVASWAAATSVSASSLVVFNALRLQREAE